MPKRFVQFLGRAIEHFLGLHNSLAKQSCWEELQNFLDEA